MLHPPLVGEFMFQQVLLWGSDRVCDFVDITGLSVAETSTGRCIFHNDTNAGIIFWAAIAMIVILVISSSRQTRRWTHFSAHFWAEI